MGGLAVVELTAVKVTVAIDDTAGTVEVDPESSETSTCWRINDPEVAFGTLNTAWLGALDSPDPIIDHGVAAETLPPASHVRCSSSPFVVS